LARIFDLLGEVEHLKAAAVGRGYAAGRGCPVTTKRVSRAALS